MSAKIEYLIRYLNEIKGLRVRSKKALIHCRHGLSVERKMYYTVGSDLS